MLRRLNPFRLVSRTALLGLLWSRRRDLARWWRSLQRQLGASGVDTAELATLGRVLLMISAEPDFAKARQLRGVGVSGSTVTVDAPRRWRALPDLLEEIRQVDGVTSVVVGRDLPDTAVRAESAAA